MLLLRSERRILSVLAIDYITTFSSLQFFREQIQNLSLSNLLLTFRIVDEAEVAVMDVGEVGRSTVLQLLAERLLECTVHERQLFIRDSSLERIIVVGAETAVGLRNRCDTSDQQLGFTDGHGIVIVGAQAAIGLCQIVRHVDVRHAVEVSEPISDRRERLVVRQDDTLIDQVHVAFGKLVKGSAKDDLRFSVLAQLALDRQTDMGLTGHIQERERASMGMSKVGRTRLAQESAELVFEAAMERFELLGAFESSHNIVIVGAQTAIRLHPTDVDVTENHLSVELGFLESHSIVVVGAETAIRLIQTDEVRHSSSGLGFEAVHGVPGGVVDFVVRGLDGLADESHVIRRSFVLHAVDNNANVSAVGLLDTEELVGSSAEVEIGRGAAEEEGGQCEGSELHR